MDSRDGDSPARTRPAARRLGLIDVLILMAAVAVGMVAIGVVSDAGGVTTSNLLLLWSWSRVPSSAQPGLPAAVDGTVAYFAPLLWVVTLALFPLRAISPAPPRRRWATRAGMASPIALAAALAFVTARHLLDLFVPPNHGPGLVAAWIGAGPFIGFGTFSAWVALAIGGRRVAGIDWVDRLGLVVGLGWIVVGLAYPLF